MAPDSGFSCDNGVGDARRLNRGPHCVNPDDRSAVQNRNGHRGQAGCLAGSNGRGTSLKKRRERVPEKRFAAYPRQKRPAQREQFALAGQQRIILLETLAKSVAGVENDCIQRDSGLLCGSKDGREASSTVASSSSEQSCGCVLHPSGGRVCASAPRRAQLGAYGCQRGIQ